MKLRQNIDWILISAVIPLLSAGLVTMHSFTGKSIFFDRQIIWITISIVVFFALSFMDFRFLRRTEFLITAFLIIVSLLTFLLFWGGSIKGAKSWIDLGFFSFQPTDPAKIILILILAKYFSRRHVEIKHMKHILVSGFYALVLTLLVFMQPDFGSTMIIVMIWFGMVLVSGISKKHLSAVLLSGIVIAGALWLFAFEDYQRQRIMSFVHPLTDIQGAGYNAHQSTIAIGSGRIMGKGIGFGTQSRLQFLPEHETDFIFAAYAEEWGFLGGILLLILFGILLWRILLSAVYGASNFEILYAIGLAIFFMAQIIVNIGMNSGLLPVTGTPLPFLSYGGSHLLTEFVSLGILMGMRKYSRTLHGSDSVLARQDDV